MFFKSKKKISIQNEGNQEIDVKVSRQVVKEREKMLQDIMGQKKLPIVILDKDWYRVKELIASDLIIQKEKELLDYMKEQGNLNNTLKENYAVKQNLMKKVLEVSEALNTNGDAKKSNELDTLHLAITKLNEELPKQQARLEEVESLIDTLNRELTREALALSYTYMESCKVASQSLGEEIYELREELLEKAKTKKKYDIQIATLYHYIHDIVGYKHIDKIDAKLGEAKK